MKDLRMTMQQKGFSLVELAIVLVIIGLITGGILTGQDLIRASELNSVIADKNKFLTAYNTFRLKYNALPGDMTNATSYWGTASGGCPIGARSGTQTCNGNGNGFVGVTNGTLTECNESLTAWQHMASAGLIPGSFTGLYTGNYCGVLGGTNAPASRIANATFQFINYSTTGVSDGTWRNFAGNYTNMLLFGTSFSGGDYASYPALRPDEAMSIDSKADDGKPAYGKVTTVKATSDISTGCTTTDVPSTAAYALTSSSTLCPLIFMP